MTLEEINTAISDLSLKVLEARKYQNEEQLKEFALLKSDVYKLCAEREILRGGAEIEFFNWVASFWKKVAEDGEFKGSLENHPKNVYL